MRNTRNMGISFVLLLLGLVGTSVGADAVQTGSAAPTENATETLSPSLSAFPSSSPTLAPSSGPELLISTGHQMLFEDIDELMDDDSIEAFEFTTFQFLRRTVLSLPGAESVEFETVRVTDQQLETNEYIPNSTPALVVTFEVLALVLYSDPAALDYHDFIGQYFDNFGPTPSPSAFPSDVPSYEPSESPSVSPSDMPSDEPSFSPSYSPSVSLAPSISMSPTNGPELLISTGHQILFERIEGTMDAEAKESFELTTLHFLRRTVQSIPGANAVEFEAVRVVDQQQQENQSLRRLTGGLLITFDVAALVLYSDPKALKYDEFFGTYFGTNDIVQPLKNELMIVSPFFDTSHAEVANNEIVGGKPTARKVSLSFALSVLLVGCVSVAYRKRKKKIRRQATSPRLDFGKNLGDSYSFSVKPTESYDETISKHSSGDESNGAGFQGIPQFRVELMDQPNDSERGEALYPSESIETSLVQSYKPSLISMESNIEIPLTPMTNRDSAQGSPFGNEVSNLELDGADGPTDQNKRSSFLPKQRFFGFGLKRGPGSEEAAPTDGSDNASCVPVHPLANVAARNAAMSSVFAGPGRLVKHVRNQRDVETPPISVGVAARHISQLPPRPQNHSRLNHHHSLSVIDSIDSSTTENDEYFISESSVGVMNEVAYLRAQEQHDGRELPAVPHFVDSKLQRGPMADGYYSDESN